MSKRMLIDARHSEETRVTIVKGNRVEEFDYESTSRQQLKGNIYLARVTRVEPSLQAAFVEYGGNRHGFLAFSEIHPDYYQLPLQDREALLAQLEAGPLEEELDEERQNSRSRRGGNTRRRSSRRMRGRPRSRNDIVEDSDLADDTAEDDAVTQNAFEAGDEASEDSLESTDALDQTADSADTDGDTDTDVDTGDTDVTGDDTPKNTSIAENAPSVSVSAKASRSEDDDADADDIEDINGDDDILSDADDSDEDDDEDEIAPDHKARSGESKADAEARKRRRYLRALKRRYSIQEVIKKRQVLLIQVVKEERGNKGAALTTYLSLAGRYCVLMPNATHSGGISRKISSSTDRKKLKSVIDSLSVPNDMGLIIRTAGIQRTKIEIKRDYEYLLRLWGDIRDLTLQSVAPCLIYEEADLVKRTIRDLYTRDIDEILVEGEEGYRSAKDFMKLLMPSHAKKVRHYRDNIPLFHRYQVETALESMYHPVVQLKSGGYIVINPTEALISIDVNSGRSTKEHNIEETAYKTNMEATEEIARQLRLRDMAGLIVVDFIDMEDRKNNQNVERRMKEMLKNDRARIQVGRISSFGLMEMSRQRLRPNLLETSMEVCPHCEGSGYVRSVEFAALSALRSLEEEGIRARSSHIRLEMNPDVAIYLLNQKRRQLMEIEQRYAMTIDVLAASGKSQSDMEITREAADPSRKPESVAITQSAVSLAPVIDDEDEDEDQTQDSVEADEDRGRESDSDNDGAGRKRRRRRRRRGRGRDGETETHTSSDDTLEDDDDEQPTKTAAQDDDEEDKKPRRRRGRRGGRRRRGERSRPSDEASSASPDADPADATSTVGDGFEPQETPEASEEQNTADAVEANATQGESAPEAESETTEKPTKRRRTSTRRKKDADTTEKQDQLGDDVTINVETNNDPRRSTDTQADTALEDVKPRPRRRVRRKADAEETETADVKAVAAQEDASKSVADDNKPVKKTASPKAEKVEETPVVVQATATAPIADEPVVETAIASPAPALEPVATDTKDDSDKPKKKGWWQKTFG